MQVLLEENLNDIRILHRALPDGVVEITIREFPKTSLTETITIISFESLWKNAIMFYLHSSASYSFRDTRT